MEITRTQRKMLEGLQGFRANGASVIGQIRSNAGVFIYLLVGALIIVPIAFLLGGWFGGFVIGILFGTVTRDIRGFMRWKKIWPVMEAVVNWQRIESLLDPGTDIE